MARIIIKFKHKLKYYLIIKHVMQRVTHFTHLIMKSSNFYNQVELCLVQVYMILSQQDIFII